MIVRASSQTNYRIHAYERAETETEQQLEAVCGACHWQVMITRADDGQPVYFGQWYATEAEARADAERHLAERNA